MFRGPGLKAAYFYCYMPMALPFTSNPFPAVISVSTPKFSPKLSSQPFPSSSQTAFPTTARNNLLLATSTKTKPIDETLQLFHLIPRRDTITWNTVISACAREGRPDTALRLFVNMLLISCIHQTPDHLTFRAVLKACVQTDRLITALQVHGYMIKQHGVPSWDLILNTVLVDLYCEFGMMDMAREVFDRMPERDAVAAVVLMAGYNEMGQYEEVLRIFKRMVDGSFSKVNTFICTCPLRASAALGSLVDGRQIHALAVKMMVQSDSFVGTALIDMYVKCNVMEDARKAFEDVLEPTAASCNALMAGDLTNNEVLDIFSQMRAAGVSPDQMTYAIVIHACEYVSLSLIQQLHALAMKVLGDEIDMFVGVALLERYMEHGCILDARTAFDAIYKKDITAFNSAIQGFIGVGLREEAVNLFYDALCIGMEPKEVILTSLLVIAGRLDEIKQLHALAVKLGFCGSSCGDGLAVASSLVSIYSELHCLDDAVRLFDQMQLRDSALWTSLISGFSKNGESQLALELYIHMVSEGSMGPNHFTFPSLLQACANLAAMEEGKQIHAQIIKSGFNVNSDPFINNGLINMYAKCGYITEARMLFEKMPERDLASWNAMITGFAQHGLAEMAVETFQELLDQPDMKPNHITFTSVLSACSHAGLVDEGYHFFGLISEPMIDHYTCLIDLVARAGRLEEARNLILEMPLHPDIYIWSSLLAASAVHGDVEMGEYAAKNLMQLNHEDPGTFVSLANIYAASGRWEDAKWVRKLMRCRGIRKNRGASWLHICGRTHLFYSETEVDDPTIGKEQSLQKHI
ncbi:hypothetical protein ACLOJK_000514 [Asimina triloba]